MVVDGGGGKKTRGKAPLRNLNPTRLGITPIGVNTRKAIDKATE